MQSVVRVGVGDFFMAKQINLHIEIVYVFAQVICRVYSFIYIHDSESLFTIRFNTFFAIISCVTYLYHKMVVKQLRCYCLWYNH